MPSTTPPAPPPAARPPIYDEDCAERRIVMLLNAKWAPLLLCALRAGTLRASQLQRCLPGISKTMLTQRLRELERDGLLTRASVPGTPPQVECTLTPLGRTVAEPLAQLCDWAARHGDELDEIECNRLTAGAAGKQS